MVAARRGVIIALHVFVVLAAAGIATTSLPPQPWPVAQHDAQRTSRAPLSGPLRANLRHEYALGPALNASPPVVSRSGRVYFTATYCLVVDPSSGCVSYWTTVLVMMPAGYARLLDPDMTHGYSGSPAIGPDGTIYVTGDSATVAFFPNGEVRWKSAPGRRSPLIAPDGSIVVISGSVAPFELLFLEAATGEAQRSVLLPELPTTDIALSTGGDIFYGAGREVVRLDPGGVERWRFDTGDLLSNPPVVGDSTVYVGARRIHALDEDGNVMWTFTPLDAFGAGTRLALAIDGTLLVQTFGAVAALTPAGTMKWQRTDSAGLGIVVDSRGVSYYVGIDGLTAVGPLGGVWWRFPLLRPFNTIFGLAIGPDGTLLAVGNRFAYALAR